MAWKPGSTLMTTEAKVGKLSVVSMMNTGGDRILCLGTEGIWSAKELIEHVEDDNAALNPVLILRFLTAHLNGQNGGGRYCRLILEGERTENPCSLDRTLLCSWGVSITSHTGMHFPAYHGTVL